MNSKTLFSMILIYSIGILSQRIAKDSIRGTGTEVNIRWEEEI